MKKRGQRGSCSSRLFHEREIILHNAVAALYAEGNWPAPPDKLVALAHAGLKVWVKVGNLQFPPKKWYALLQEIMRYCAWRCLLACGFTQEHRLERIARAPQPIWQAAVLNPSLGYDTRREAAARVRDEVISVYNSGYGTNGFPLAQQPDPGLPRLAGA